MEDIAEQKFEEMAEIKAVLKKINPEDTEAVEEKKQELNEVKARMDQLKEQKISEAK